jgi:hypothetical protein
VGLIHVPKGPLSAEEVLRWFWVGCFSVLLGTRLVPVPMAGAGRKRPPSSTIAAYGLQSTIPMMNSRLRPFSVIAVHNFGDAVSLRSLQNQGAETSIVRERNMSNPWLA